MARASFDPESDAKYIEVRRGKYEISEEVSENIVVDLNETGRVLGIGILDVSKRLKKRTLDRMLKAEALAAR